jgi:hypothetical protein
MLRKGLLSLQNRFRTRMLFYHAFLVLMIIMFVDSSFLYNDVLLFWPCFYEEGSKKKKKKKKIMVSW